MTMTREQIIRSLKECNKEYRAACENCDYRDVHPAKCVKHLINDAIHLLELDSPDSEPVPVEIPIYDIEEIHHGCTVQVLTSSVTGESSVGWWKEEE